MKPQRRQKIDYEKVQTGDFINGKIADIQYDDKHEFKFQGQVKIASACRFVFELENYKFKHYSRWLNFSYGEKSNLFKRFLDNLVLGAVPHMDFDLDLLKGMKVKTIWQGEDFQSIELIRPIGEKYTTVKFADFDKKADEPPLEETNDQGIEEPDAEDIPF